MLTTDAVAERLAALYDRTDASEQAVARSLLRQHDYIWDYEGLTLNAIADGAQMPADQAAEVLRRFVAEGLCLRVRRSGTDDQYRLNHTVAHQLAGTTAHDAAAGLRSGYRVAGEERLKLYQAAKQTDAWQLLNTVFNGWRFIEHLTTSALRRLADGQMLNPNDDIWRRLEAAATSVLHRHGLTNIHAAALTEEAIATMRDAQRQADADAGLTWEQPVDAAAIADQLRAAHRNLPLDFDDPRVWVRIHHQRAALGRRHRLESDRVDDLSRWALANPDRFDAGEARCWRIGSPSWLELVDEQLGPFDGDVAHPVGVIVLPANSQLDAWSLRPALSLEMLRLVADLGGTIIRDLAEFAIPVDRVGDLVARMNTNVLLGPRHAGRPGEKASENLTAVNQELGIQLAHIHPTDRRDIWGRLRVQCLGDTVNFAVQTVGGRIMSRRRFGGVSSSKYGLGDGIALSAPMDLGEAVGCAVERGLPLLLSTEAAGHLDGQIRVGRMKGRPGQLTITRSDGLAAHTQRVPTDQALVELRRLRDSGQPVVLDAGARQIVEMLACRPLADDPVLLGRQTEVAALKAVGSGLDASQVGTGKSVTSGRAIYHRAVRTPRFRGLLTANGRLLEQWRDELLFGAPGRLPPLAPNVDVLIVDEQRSIAGQLRAWDQRLGDQPGLALVPDSLLDRYPGDLCALKWHLWIADEALRYVNPATEAHRSARQVRFEAVADCWMLSGTPKGKSAEHLDVLIGLALGDQAMIDERLNTREAGDLLLEDNAHRVRLNYGPTMVRITDRDMANWMPTVRPAEPLAISPDAALQELLDAIRQGGREDYQRLLQAIKRLKAIEEQQGKKTDIYRQAMAEVSRWQAFVLANVNVFVDASVDPETLLHSNAALAQALVQSGKVAAAMRGGGDGLPTLRGIVAQTLARTCEDQQVLVFAERTRPLHQLARTLHERWGVVAPVADGRLSTDEFAELKSRFVEGEFPILMLSPVGNAGHNLQNASGILHLDLPWVQTRLEQRVGRSRRLGNQAGFVQTWIPYIRGGGIEHVVAILAARGAEHHQLLDAFEGVKAAESTIASQLGAITSQVAAAKDEAGQAQTAARMRVAAAVFGA